MHFEDLKIKVQNQIDKPENQVMGKGDLIHGKGRKEGEGVEMVEAGQGLLTAT